MMTRRTVVWEPNGPTVEMIDQRKLPANFEMLSLRSASEVAEAIRDMAIRGAPAIGAAAAFGLALAGAQSKANEVDDLMRELQAAASLLNSARPTAANLGWALDRLMAVARNESEVEAIRRSLIEEAQSLADEDVEINRRIGGHGAALINDGDTVIHHCNTGSLATVDFGTALGVIRTAHERGARVHVLVDETRPRLQGARLTAWELDQLGIPYEIIADNAAGHFLRQEEVSSVFVGADRVASNGDIANKIGTYMLALAARDCDVPFYCAVPTSTIDISLGSGEEIVIEERDSSEVLNLERNGQPTSPANSHARNPAFDVTPHRLITAFITEAGLLYPPFSVALRRVVDASRTS